MFARLRRLITAPRRLAELQRTHAELEREARRLRTLVETTAAVVWSANGDGRAPPASGSWSAYTGQTLDEHAGLGWLDAVHPDDREATRERWLYSVKHQIPYEVEYRLRRADGSWANVI